MHKLFVRVVWNEAGHEADGVMKPMGSEPMRLKT